EVVHDLAVGAGEAVPVADGGLRLGARAPHGGGQGRHGAGADDTGQHTTTTDGTVDRAHRLAPRGFVRRDYSTLRPVAHPERSGMARIVIDPRSEERRVGKECVGVGGRGARKKKKRKELGSITKEMSIDAYSSMDYGEECCGE